MGFFESVKTVFSKYAVFSGRASRSEYWYFVLFNVIIGMLFSIGLYPAVPKIIEANSVDVFTIVDYMPGWLCTIASLYQLFIIIPSIAVSVRRLHDTGKGGGWIFINLVPVIGGIWFLVLTIIGSQDGPNRFGPMPED